MTGIEEQVVESVAEEAPADLRPRKLLLRNSLSPGDIITLTAAVRDLHLTHPGRFLTDLRTSCAALWQSNPYLTPLDEGDPEVEEIRCEYPLIHRSNHVPYHMLHGFRLFLQEKLGVRIEPHFFRGDIHLSAEEKSWMSQVEEIEGGGTRFWIIVSGGKRDFTAKWWDPDRAQRVVDHFQGRIRFVQCGELSHHHPPLRGALNLLGKTDLRQVVRLMWHADGVVCPVTMFMHLAAAVETRPGRPRNRPCVVVAGGREPSQWEAYPHHQYLHVNGSLPCCANGGCWKSRVEPLGDGDAKDQSLCLLPVRLPSGQVVPKCLDMITAANVIDAVEKYLEYEAAPRSAVPVYHSKGAGFMNKEVTRQQMEEFAELLNRAKEASVYSPEAFQALHARFRAEDSKRTPWSVGIASRKWHCLLAGTWAAGEPPRELYLDEGVLQAIEQLRPKLPPLKPPPTSGQPCHECGITVREGKKFCANCGAVVAEQGLQCAKCGEALEPGAKFCDSCGTKTSASIQPPPTQPLERRCPKCARALKAAQKFCPSCGVTA